MKTVFTITILLISAVSFAQVSGGTDYNALGTHSLFNVRPCNPVCWLNANNEFNAYFEQANEIHLFTLLNDKKTEFSGLPEFNSLIWAENLFVLHSAENENYYFIVGNDTEHYIKGILNHTYPATKTYSGAGVAHHTWTKGTGKHPGLEQLKAAASIYNALEGK